MKCPEKANLQRQEAEWWLHRTGGVGAETAAGGNLGGD